MTTVLAVLEGGTIFVALWLMAEPAHAVHSWLDARGHAGLPGLLAICAVAALYYADCYDLGRVPSVSRLAPRLPRGLALAAVPLGASFIVFPESGTAALATLVLMVGLPPLVRGAFYPILRSRRFVERVLIVGGGALAQQVADIIRAQAGYRYVVAEMIDDTAVQLGSRSRRLRTVHALDRAIETIRPDRIVVALADHRHQPPVHAFLEARSRGIIIDEGAEFYERLAGKIAIEAVTPWSLIFSKGFRRSRATVDAARVLSVVLAGMGLVLAAPLLGLIALAIKVDSPGPVFFRQERVGLAGRRFTLVKFRTMHAGDDSTASEWAGDHCHRITRVGRWLRAFRLDELPQFVNILRGDMDIVGPRPHPGSNYSLFVTVLRNLPECGEEIPYYSLRSMVRPGITGWAQVRYRYANNLEEEIEKMRYDLYYVKHRSLLLDLRILAATVKTIVAGRGAMEERLAPVAAPLPPARRLVGPR